MIAREGVIARRRQAVTTPYDSRSIMPSMRLRKGEPRVPSAALCLIG